MSIDEESPSMPRAGGVRDPIERRVLAAEGMRGVVITSGVAYGDGGGGVPGVLLGSPRDDDGNLIMLGSGQQHWDTVHAADLAEVFRRVLEDESARGRYAVTDGLNPTVAEITEAAAVAVGAPGASPAPMRRLAHAWATISPKCCCSIRTPRPRRFGNEPDWRPSLPGSSRSSAVEATAR